MQDAADDNPARLSEAQRLSLLERDSRDHAKTLSIIVDKMGKGFSEEQLDQMRGVLNDVLADAGLRVNEPHDQDAAREDFRFIRRLRLAWDSAGKKVGNAVLFGALGILGSIIGLGFWAWLSQHLNK